MVDVHQFENPKTHLIPTFLEKSPENVVTMREVSTFQLAYITLGLYALILVVSGPAEFFCNMVAFIYPAYASVVVRFE